MHTLTIPELPADLAGMLALARPEFRLAMSVPGLRIGEVVTRTTSLAEATGTVERWVRGMIDPQGPGRTPTGARVLVTVRPLAYPGTPPATVLDVTLVRRRLTTTGPLAYVWRPTQAAVDEAYQRATELLRGPDDGAVVAARRKGGRRP